MGVPKFFRYISERYPCLMELIKEFQIPDFDNLYLDMNGIIHNCSHPNDYDVCFRISEEKIFASIFHYIEILFSLIKPRKLFFIAVDGVAPRAKMNQQRARRFMSAKEAEMMEKKAVAEGKELPATERFDSNCITPGTVFMDRLHQQLKYFITSKISTDPLWQRCKVIYSGHQTPGEGEHKIMDYIRYIKSKPNYDPNTRHCLYGLDADLLILGLSTHEPHFSILREKVSFTRSKNKKIVSPDETEFYLLHLSLFRDYLDLEFQELKTALPFSYNLENIIDDWILMGFLVGNDFIPHLPDLHIVKGALPILYKAYKEVLPTLDGYLNENGNLNLERFQKYMKKLGEHDLETFEEAFVDFSIFDSKEEGSLDEEYDTFLTEFDQHKKNYYTNKLGYTNVTEEVLKSQAEGYVKALQWNLFYYYQGCPSWSWFYPHHYSPYISDITNFEGLKIEFDMGKPFTPFQQLLAVLPPKCKKFLPETYQDLMVSPNSPIIDFYPENFETDLNTKQHQWESIVLIPFIDEKRLLEAMEPYSSNLTQGERRRNTHGPMHIYCYTEEDLGIYKAVEYFPSVTSNHAAVEDVFVEEIKIDKSEIKFGLNPLVLLDVMYPGFPTLKHIPFKACLKSSKVKVFEMPSRGDNMILTLERRDFPDVTEVANSILGKTVHVNWPHLVESKVVAVSDMVTRYDLKNEEIQKTDLDKSEAYKCRGQANGLKENYFQRLGVDIGPVEVVIYVNVLEGRKYICGASEKLTEEKLWSPSETPIALQTIVQNISVHPSHTLAFKDLHEAFPINSTVFMLGHPHFGSKGRVIDTSNCAVNGRLTVALETVNDPLISHDLLKAKVQYMSCKTAAMNIGINPRLFSRITGSVLIVMSADENANEESAYKANIGLNLKFHRKNEELPGYTRKDNDNWLYSKKAMDCTRQYVEKFPRVMEYLSCNLNKNFYSKCEIFPEPDGAAELKEMLDWVKQQDHIKEERIQCGSEFLDGEIVAEIEKVVDNFSEDLVIKNIQVKPHLLYKSDLYFGNIAPVKSAKHQLLDRVVSIRSSYTVPAGLRGFIIAIRKAPVEVDNMYDILFDKPFPGGMTINSSPNRAYRLSRISFVNISDARRSNQPKVANTTIPNFFPNFKSINTSLRPANADPNASAFAEWNQKPPTILKKKDDEFQEIWTNLQGLKSQEGTTFLKKLLKIENEEKPVVEDNVKMFIQNVASTSMPPNNWKNSAAKNDVTQRGNIAKEAHNTDSKNKYQNQLFSYHQIRNLGQPKFKYVPVRDKVISQAVFNDGRVYTGLPCSDKESACESVSVKVLRDLGIVPSNKESLTKEDNDPVLRNQRKLQWGLFKGLELANQNLIKATGSTTSSNDFAAVRNQHPVRGERGAMTRGDEGRFYQHNNYNHFKFKNVPPKLPHPPKQWVRRNAPPTNPPFQSNQFHKNHYDDTHSKFSRKPHEKPQFQKHQKSNTPADKSSASSSALEFVPLQAITGKRSVRPIATTQSSTPSRSKKFNESSRVQEIVNDLNFKCFLPKSRHKKIAANLNFDTDIYF